VEKYGGSRQAIYDNIILRMRIACWMSEATDTRLHRDSKPAVSAGKINAAAVSARSVTARSVVCAECALHFPLYLTQPTVAVLRQLTVS